jgi:hypothetical protein
MPTRKQLADQYHITERLIGRAAAVEKRGNPALTAARESNMISLSVAELLALYYSDDLIEEHLAEVAAAASYRERREAAAVVRRAVALHRAEGMMAFKCRQCGETFSCKRMNRRYCSDVCRQAGYRARVERRATVTS